MGKRVERIGEGDHRAPFERARRKAHSGQPLTTRNCVLFYPRPSLRAEGGAVHDLKRRDHQAGHMARGFDRTWSVPEHLWHGRAHRLFGLPIEYRDKVSEKPLVT